MKKIFYLTLILIASSIYAIDLSADTVISEGLTKLIAQVPPAENFPNANYYVITESTVVTLSPDGSYNREIYFLAKLYNFAGKRELSNYKINFNSDFQKVELIRARTINGNVVIPVNEKSVNDISHPHYSDAAMYGDFQQKVISLPAVSESSVVEIHAIVKTDTNTSMPFGKLVILVDEPPTRKRFYEVKFPKGVELTWKSISGAPKPRKNPTSLIWEITDYKGENIENNTLPLREVFPTILYSLSKTWKDESAKISKITEPKIVVNEKIKSATEKIVGDKKGKEAISAILFYIQQNFTQIDTRPEYFGYEPNTAPKVLENGRGDSKDLSVLLATMLRAIGIDASLALVPSYGARIYDIPISYQMNEFIVIAWLDGKKYFLYPSKRYAEVGYLGRASGEKSLIIDPQKGELIQTDLLKPSDGYATYNFDVNITPDGKAEGTVTLECSGIPAMHMRATFRDQKKRKVKQLFQEAASNISSGTSLVPDTMLRGIETNTGTLNAKLGFTIDNYMMFQGDMGLLWFPDPPFMLLSYPAITEQSRDFPLYNPLPQKFIFKYKINFPVGYELVYAPPEQKIDNKFGNVIIYGNNIDNTIEYTVEFELEKCRVSPEKYKDYKELIKTFRKKGNRIVLFKKIV